MFSRRKLEASLLLAPYLMYWRINPGIAQVSIPQILGAVQAFGQAAGLARDLLRVFRLIPSAQAEGFQSVGVSASAILRSQPAILDDLQQLRIDIRSDIRQAFLEQDVITIRSHWEEFNNQVVNMNDGQLRRDRLAYLHGEASKLSSRIATYDQVDPSGNLWRRRVERDSVRWRGQ